ncbi:hypothetical protein ABVK25_010362 [Lepraria finkii]|uniref:Uncharacterized protein n=1 Tax=Lepraria finkii TaxID=1340010 RepID=A0ABR4AWP7_9LECA
MAIKEKFRLPLFMENYVPKRFPSLRGQERRLCKLPQRAIAHTWTYSETHKKSEIEHRLIKIIFTVTSLLNTTTLHPRDSGIAGTDTSISIMFYPSTNCAGTPTLSTELLYDMQYAT